MRLICQRHITILLTAFLLTLSVYGQKKEKVKGSRIVTNSQREISDFTSLEFEDNIEVFLLQGNKCELQIEADDNLHEAITVNESSGNLRIGVSKDVYGAKKLSVRVTFTDALKLVTAKNDAYVTGLNDINLTDFTFKTSGSAKVYATIKAGTFTLMQNDKSKVELTLRSQNATIELSKSSQLKSIVSCPKLKLDLYQKSLANLEGEVTDLRLRMDSNTNLTAKALTAKNAEITTEGNSNCIVMVEARAILEASGKSEIELLGEPKIEVKKFTNNATLRKRALK